jgi:trehalose 6-phosphate phosphatase
MIRSRAMDAILGPVDAAPAGASEVGGLVAPLRSNPETSAILCDVDGTLAPIVDRPDAAAVLPRARELLEELVQRYALVGCVTGRRAAKAREMVGVEGVVYAGNHGFELLEPGAEEPVADPAVRGRAERAAGFVGTLDAEWLRSAGLRVEAKGPIAALHWRGAEMEAPAELRAKEIAKLAQGAGLVPRWGRKVLELRPVAGIDKGSAALALLRRGDARHALFGGDDLTDLDGFRALRWMLSSGRLETAVCAGVASDEEPPGLREAVDLMVDGPEGFAAVLEELAR